MQALPLAVVWLPTVDSVLSFFQFVQLLTAAGRYLFNTQIAPKCFSSAKHFASKVESAMSIAAAAATASVDASTRKSVSHSQTSEQREMDRNFEEAAWRRIQHKLSMIFSDELPRGHNLDGSVSKKCDLPDEKGAANATSVASLAERWNPLLRLISEHIPSGDDNAQAQVTEAHSRAATLVEAITRLARDLLPVMSATSGLTVYLLGAGFKEGRTHRDVKATFRLLLNWLLWQQCRDAVVPATMPALQVDFVLVGTEVPYRADEISVSSMHTYDGPSELLPNAAALAVRTHFLQGLYHELDEAIRVRLFRVLGGVCALRAADVCLVCSVAVVGPVRSHYPGHTLSCAFKAGFGGMRLGGRPSKLFLTWQATIRRVRQGHRAAVHHAGCQYLSTHPTTARRRTMIAHASTR